MYRESTQRRCVATRGNPKVEACPTDEDLICLASGELPSGESRDIRRHLDQCSSCQASLRELGEVFQATAIVVAEDEEPRDQGLRQYAEFRRALRARSWSEPQKSVAFRRILPVAAMLLAAILPVVIARTTQYNAGTVVQHAVDRERPGGLAEEPHEPLRFRWIPEYQPDEVKAPSSTKGSGRAPSFLLEVTDPTSEIAWLLDSHGFNRREPLSASRLATWRAALSAHSDRVVRRDGLLYVRTLVPHGKLREVVVVIREDDWRVVGQEWVFSDLGRLRVERRDSDVFASMSQPSAPRKGDTR